METLGHQPAPRMDPSVPTCGREAALALRPERTSEPFLGSRRHAGTSVFSLATVPPLACQTGRADFSPESIVREHTLTNAMPYPLPSRVPGHSASKVGQASRGCQVKPGLREGGGVRHRAMSLGGDPLASASTWHLILHTEGVLQGSPTTMRQGSGTVVSSVACPTSAWYDVSSGVGQSHRVAEPVSGRFGLGRHWSIRPYRTSVVGRSAGIRSIRDSETRVGLSATRY